MTEFPSSIWTTILSVRKDPGRVRDLVVRRYRQPVHLHRRRHHDLGSRRLIDPDQCHGRQRRRRLRLLQLHLLRRVDQPAQHDLHVGSTPDYEQHHGELRLRRLGGGFNLHVPL